MATKGDKRRQNIPKLTVLSLLLPFELLRCIITDNKIRLEYNIYMNTTICECSDNPECLLHS